MVCAITITVLMMIIIMIMKMMMREPASNKKMCTVNEEDAELSRLGTSLAEHWQSLSSDQHRQEVRS